MKDLGAMEGDFSFALSGESEATKPLTMEFAEGLCEIPAHLVAFAGGPEELQSQAEAFKVTPFAMFLAAAERAQVKTNLNAAFGRSQMFQLNKKMMGYR